MAIKLDMKKSYDRFNWQFIKKCFSDLGSKRNGQLGLWNVSQ